MERSPTPRLGGVIREEQNWIGGSSYNPCSATFVPPPAEHVQGLLEDLTVYINGDEHPALVQAAIAHAQFETIHPFADGNGRTGRALIHIILRRRGLAPAFRSPCQPRPRHKVRRLHLRADRVSPPAACRHSRAVNRRTYLAPHLRRRDAASLQRRPGLRLADRRPCRKLAGRPRCHPQGVSPGSPTWRPPRRSPDDRQLSRSAD